VAEILFNRSIPFHPEKPVFYTCQGAGIQKATLPTNLSRFIEKKQSLDSKTTVKKLYN
jgi:hypothetical protein